MSRVGFAAAAISFQPSVVLGRTCCGSLFKAHADLDNGVGFTGAISGHDESWSIG